MHLDENIQLSSNDSNTLDTQHSRYVTVIDEIYNCVNTHLLTLMNHMLSSADKKLIEKADNVDSEVERSKYINCTQIFKTESNDISQLFFINLNKSLAMDKSSGDDSEEFVFQDEMEEMVAITTMHSKAMKTYGEEVNNLETRLEYLEIICDDIFDKESLDPKHICEIFQRTIENIDLAIEAKLIFYKLFDQEVCSKLGIMYAAVNKIFIDNNIMPEIVMKSTKDSEVEYLMDDVSSRVATYYDPEENIQTDFVPRTKAEISRIVNEFMAGDMTITGDEIDLPESFLRVPTPQELEGKNCYQRQDVVKALSKLQHKLINMKKHVKPLTTEQIKNELLEDISLSNIGEGDKRVNLLDERSIDFIGMMFEAISDDESVSDLMTDMIKRLQIPYMKIAMSDDTLFSNEDHPARIIVNQLTSLGKGINNADDKLYAQLETVVDNILNEYDTDLTVFERSIRLLETIIQDETKSSTRTEQLQQKEIIFKHAKKIVTAQFRILLRNKVMPEVTRPLLMKNWASLMLNRYIRYGRNTIHWNHSVSLLKLVLKCIQPITFKSQFHLILNNHEALTESINDELDETRQDKKQIKQQIDALNQYLSVTIEDSCFLSMDDLTPPENEYHTTELDNNDVDIIEDETRIAEQKLSLLSDMAVPGAWYEIYTGKDKALRRLKLSIIMNESASLIFVDRKGLKVIEKDAEIFADELETNRSRIIADHSTFDHALGKVIGNFSTSR